ncbi:hypothetical protein GCM10022288_20180 [Gryllotalpicola kribbensis]|uniref:FHA domain-containing protein n=1 Tax=Gryllotalpicola kribbensis TaxID=993084 RepID=A0ABP8AU57_9MICO
MTPSYTDAVSTPLGGGAGLAVLLAPLVVALAIWLIVVPLGLRGIFEALSVDRSRAWIPFVNIATVYRLGGMSEFWLIALVIPIVNVVGAIMLFIATHRINRKLGRSGWYTVLAVVAWWVWTLALGLQRRIDLRASSEPLVWSAQRPPQAPLTIPTGDDSQQPLDETPISAAGFIAPMPGMAAPDAPAEPTRAPQPVPLVPSAPQPPLVDSAKPNGDPALPSQVDAPTPLSPVDSAQPNGDPAAPASVTPELELDNDATIIRRPQDDETIITGNADATVISARRRPRWWVHTTMGARVELTGASAILGRRPSAHPLYPGAQLIAVTDDALSVSATHAVLEFVGGDWHITDLDSTNGVWLIDPRTNEESELGARNRARVTPQFMLGELGVKVVQGA